MEPPHPLLLQAEEFLYQLNPRIPLYDPSTGPLKPNQVAWFLPPRDLVVELLIMTPLLALVVGYILFVHKWEVETPAVTEEEEAERRKSHRSLWQHFLDVWELLGPWVSLVTYIASWVYKLPTGRAAYMLQPCHLFNLLIIIISFSKSCGKKSAFLERLFFFNLCHAYGAGLALATPDTAGQDQFMEVQVFYILHINLLVLPLIWAARRRFPVFKGWLPAFGMYLLFVAMHFHGFSTASILSYTNINYMLFPPKTLRQWGRWYRPWMTGVVWFLVLFARYGMLPMARLLCGPGRKTSKKELKEGKEL